MRISISATPSVTIRRGSRCPIPISIAVGQKLYARYIGELELADQLGFDGICVNEHHQTAYGLMPAPNLIAAALARSTKQAKIAILGRALPLVSNPVAVAE